MQIFFSHSVEDQNIASDIILRLAKIPGVEAIITELDSPERQENNGSITKCDYYFWLISKKHTKPNFFSLFDTHYTSIRKKNAMICIHLEDCRFLDIPHIDTFINLPCKKDRVVHLESKQWRNSEKALTEVINQVSQIIQGNEKQKELELSSVKAYLSLLGIDSFIIEADRQGRGILVHDPSHRILFVPISFQSDERYVKPIREFAEYEGNDINQFFFFPMDIFEDKNISIKDFEENIKETISWIQNKKLVEKLFVVSTNLCVDKNARTRQKQKEGQANRKNASPKEAKEGAFIQETKQRLLNMIDTDLDGALDEMGKLDWGNDLANYNDKRNDWIDQPNGFNKSNYRSQLKTLLKKHFSKMT